MCSFRKLSQMSGEQLNLDEADAFLFVRRLTNSQLESHKQVCFC